MQFFNSCKTFFLFFYFHNIILYKINIDRAIEKMTVHEPRDCLSIKNVISESYLLMKAVIIP